MRVLTGILATIIAQAPAFADDQLSLERIAVAEANLKENALSVAEAHKAQWCPLQPTDQLKAACETSYDWLAEMVRSELAQLEVTKAALTLPDGPIKQNLLSATASAIYNAEVHANSKHGDWIEWAFNPDQQPAGKSK